MEVSDLTHERVTEYTGFLRTIGELPSDVNREDNVRQEIRKYIHSLSGSFDVFLHEVTKTDNRQSVFDYFYRQLQSEPHTVRRIQDIAEDLNKRPDQVYRAVSPLVGLVYMRPIKWRSDGDYVDCYPPVVRHLGKKLTAVEHAHNLSPPPKARAIITTCARHVYHNSDYEMTNGMEAIYAPEFLEILPPDKDIRISINTDPEFGYMEVILRTKFNISSNTWSALEEACRIQTRAIVNRMTYNPDNRKLLGSEHMSGVVRKIARDESCTCADEHCVHFTVLPSDEADVLLHQF